ncbi:P-loop containing nucleoside triphosphate hydrolase protein [Dichomitus squalens]|uniref:P-loop containing nucleoside triphosphate hydrolase protein n=1 Tax=Dichomitus squalens TaxID=114155 RepID=A0A4Q9PAT8_9APHY|nr:P-loop containing nucleoside triphosphate hydrolase protein [Dichomitus squalens]TBU51075.1 P-loop containing nucleoside triphosphate hydrolase protein [Dichomitus squalens]
MMGDGGLENSLDDAENAEPQSLEHLAHIHLQPPTHGKLRAHIELKALRVVDVAAACVAVGMARAWNAAPAEPRGLPDDEGGRHASGQGGAQLPRACGEGVKEQRRIERLASEGTEERLIDTAKDTRITHLLKQTDARLDSLAGGRGAAAEGPVSEATFDAKAFSQEEDHGKLGYYAVAHRLKEKILMQPSILVDGTLRDYQLKGLQGLQWMVTLYNNNLNGILADKMGLRKTIQMISPITFFIESKKHGFAKWAPSVKMISDKGNPAQRKVLQTDLRTSNFQVVLTTYEYIIKERIHLSRMKWIYMIIDEGHCMKNTEIFNSGKSFDEWFNTPFANSGTGDKIELNEEEALLIIRRLHKVLRPFLLHRLKDVESELPDKIEKVIKVRMSALQSQLYKQMKKYKMVMDVEDAKGIEDRVNPSSMIDDKLVWSSGKIKLLSRILPKFFATDHRSCTKFETSSDCQTNVTKVVDIMEDFLKMMGWKYLRLDGGKKTEDRAGHVQLFNAPNPEYKVFILSTRAGGLALNLQTADTVVIFDSDWNPHADLQAHDHAYHIGQTEVVHILQFITEKSIEESMFARSQYKLDIDDKVI